MKKAHENDDSGLLRAADCHAVPGATRKSTRTGISRNVETAMILYDRIIEPAFATE